EPQARLLLRRVGPRRRRAAHRLVGDRPGAFRPPEGSRRAAPPRPAAVPRSPWATPHRRGGRGLMAHPWHDVRLPDDPAAWFPVFIEIPMGSKVKYELEKRTGLLRVDRVLYSAVHYPANYGFVPRTYCDDDDPLDVLVLGEEVAAGVLVRARAI